MICITILPKSLEELKNQFAAALAEGDLVEIRLDVLGRAGLKALPSNPDKRIIVTCRNTADGGYFEGTDEERSAILLEALNNESTTVDIEIDLLEKETAQWPLGRVVASYHNFQSTPDDLAAIYSRLERTGAGTIKLITFANTLADNFRVLDILKNAKRPTVAHCMGAIGLVSRVLGRKFGTCWTYSSLDDIPVAPGILTVGQLKTKYRAMSISSCTNVFGIIGSPLSHSLSPTFHNTEFEASGSDAVYIPFETDNPREIFDYAGFLGLKGLSVTHPCKEKVLALLDGIEPDAKKIGGVNTVIFGCNDGNVSSLGYNTDWIAVRDILLNVAHEEWGSSNFEGRTVAVIGNGGAARAALYAINKISELQGVIINKLVVARNPVKGNKMASEFGAECTDRVNIADRHYDIMINATPVGMAPDTDAIPVIKDAIRHHSIIFDMIYQPGITALLYEAERRGCRCVNGMAMFLAQAELQADIFRKALI